MAHVDDDRPSTEALPRSGQAPPFEALFPNLDKVSRSSLRKGSLSRRRITIAAIVLGLVLIVVIGLILFSDAIFGPM
jgi:hypothetical protein